MYSFLRSIACGVMLAAELAAAGSSVGHRHGGPMPSDSPVPAVRSRLDEFGAAVSRALVQGDVTALARLWTADVRLMAEYHPTLVGMAQARPYWEAMVTRLATSAHVRERIAALDLGDKVVEIGRFRWEFAMRANGAPRQVAGKYFEVWRKVADGALAVETMAWNYDRYPPFQDELRFPELPGVRAAFEPRLPVTNALMFELAALLKLHESAVVQHDAGVWARFYADDAMLLPNHSAMQAGRAAIDAYVDRHARELPVFEKLDLRHDRIDDLGGHAIEYGSHVANWRNGNQSGVNTGKAVRLWRREADCSLRILWAIAMYD